MREGARGRTEQNNLICQREGLYQIKLSSVKLVEWRDPSSFTMECTSKLIKKRLPFPFITHDKLIRKKAYFKGQSNHEQLSTSILEVGAIKNDKSP